MNWPDDFVNKIICGDCLEVMKEMPDECVDFIFTSPPFKDSSELDKRRKYPGDIDGDYWPWYKKLMKELTRITKDYALIFNSSTRLIDIIKKFKKPYRILVWNKGYLRTAFRYEPIFIYKFDADYSLNKHIYKDVFNVEAIPGQKQVVPNENPIKLYSHLIDLLPKNKIILDPFLGSGTTAVACKNLKRNFIGIEINPEYCKIAEKRLAQGVL